MLDINVQHEVPHTSPLLTIPVSVILEYTIFNPSETVTTASATIISSLFSSLFPSLQHSTLISTPTITEATTSAPSVLESKTLNAIHLRLSYLEKEVKELKNVDTLQQSFQQSNLKSQMPSKSTLEQVWMILAIRKQQVPKETITSSDIVALEELSRKLPYAMDEGVADKLKKTKPDDADKDKGHSARSDRGLKRQRTSKGTKTSKNTSTSKDSSKGKSPSTSLKSSKSGKSAKDQVEEPIFVQDSDYATHDDAEFDNTDMPMDQGEDLDKTNEQPNDEDVPKNDYNDKKYTTFTTKSKAARYKLKGIEDMVPNLWSPIKHDVYSTKRILSIISVKVNEWCGYSHLEEIVVKRADRQLYTFKEVHLAASLRMFARRTFIQSRVKDLQLGVESYQKKLNFTKPRTRDVDMSRRPACTFFQTLKVISMVDAAGSRQVKIHSHMLILNRHIDKVLKLKNFKQDENTSFQEQEKYEHVSLKVTSTQYGKRPQDDDSRLYLVDDLKEAQVHIQVKLKGTSSSLKSKDHYA
ncbi:hypothetical protein Tco_0804705 [Tanacetum coccineum]|uniref:Uncharacterized protein n=1 Tax=Tanacetum coccineum TaxID=301880 RepID=A0ABQ5A996_9ASTR